MPEAPPARPFVVDRLVHRTIPALLWAAAEAYPHRPFLRVVERAGDARALRTITYQQFVGDVEAAAAWLRAQGLGPGERVLIFADNSPEWQAFAIAATLLGAQPAAAFSSLDSAPVREIEERAKPAIVFAGTRAHWEKLGSATPPRAVLCGEELPARLVPEGTHATTIDEVFKTPRLERGEARRLVDAVGPHSPFLLIFTSGTTGRQKGVPVTQDAMVHTLDAFRSCTHMNDRDFGLMFLPYAHIAGQAQFHLAHATAHTLIHASHRDDLPFAFSEGPTYALAVPLIYERVLRSVEKELASKPLPLRWSLERARLAAGRVRCDGSRNVVDRLLTEAFDRTVGAGVRKKLGGSVRALFAGGAPTPPALWRFFESIGIPYVQAYGMSETAACIATHTLDLPRSGDSVGYLSPDIDARFEPDGELCVKGPAVFSGYLDPSDDTGAFTPDGYFRTGDQGQLEPDGRLRLRGRKKSLLVLSTGKKVAPEPVEEALCVAPPVGAAVLIGEGRPFVTAAVFVSADVLRSLQPAPEAKLLALAHSRLGSFSEYERPHRLLVIPGVLADFPDLLTPSQKLKRDAFFTRFGPELDQLYAPRG